MISGAIIDTGPLVAFLTEGSEHHEWACSQWKSILPPFITCEAVLTEAAFLLKRDGQSSDALLALIERRVVKIGFQVSDEVADLRGLMHRYRNRPMSLADACIVRLSELHTNSFVLTLDRDFQIYRRFGNRTIPVVMPENHP